MEALRESLAMSLPVKGGWIEGALTGMQGAHGAVIFAHGSGSRRFSPRNQAVAEQLRRCGLATLLLDLLTVDEVQERSADFDIGLLSSRLLLAAEWVKGMAGAESLRLGYFGSSTGAAAALTAAAEKPALVQAVVSRGGRPDLAGGLGRVQAPTLLIVGGEDQGVLGLNQHAYGALQCQKDLRIIPGAGHLFDEPGALEQVAQLSADWFLQNLL
jgi:putative phosphoribosyl transferase